MLTWDQNSRAVSWLGWMELRDLLSLALRGSLVRAAVWGPPKMPLSPSLSRVGCLWRGILGRAGLFGGAAAEDTPSLSWARAPSPCPVPKHWESAASLGSLLLHPSPELHREGVGGGPEKTEQTELEQLNPCSATSYFYLPRQHLGSHGKSALAALAALPRAPGRCLPQRPPWPGAVAER